MKKTILVIFGGKSPEHEVSLVTAMSIINGLNLEKYRVFSMLWEKDGYFSKAFEIKGKLKDVDDLIKIHKEFLISKQKCRNLLENLLDFLYNICENPIIFPALHGNYGEDGKIQGLFEILNLTYVGNGVASSAIGMDKVICKDIYKKHGIPQAIYVGLEKKDIQDKNILISKIKELKFPLYVKPARMGSSIGISRVENEVELEGALKLALKYDWKIILEEELKGREMQISVIGNENPIASEVGEFIQEGAYMDYHTKYTPGKLKAVIPARLTSEQRINMRKDAVKAYEVIGGQGLSRVDFFVMDDGNYYINEINTMPGFTMQSMTPKLWEAIDGTAYTELLEKLIDFAIHAHEREQVLEREYKFEK